MPRPRRVIAAVGAQRGEVVGRELGVGRRLVAGRAQALLERERARAGAASAARGGRRRGRPAARRRAPARRARAARGGRAGRGSGPWRGGSGSSTTPPPSVSGGASERITRRSPRAGHERLLEAQLEVAPAELREPRRGLARAVVDRDARAAVGPARRASPTRARRRRGSAADERARRPPRSRRRARPRRAPRPARLSATRWPASARSTRLVVDLDRAHAGGRARGEDQHLVAAGGGARPQRAGDDRPGAADRERAVDVQPQRPVRSRLPGTRRRGPLERRAQRPRCPRRGAPPPATISAPGSSSAASAAARAGSARSAFVIATTPAPTPERAQHRGVLARLRHHAVVGGDDHQEQVDPRRPGDHRAHEALVARHVDDRQPPPRRQLERRVAELDRDPALLLLRQPVGVDAGEGADERRSCRGRCGRRCRA